MTIEPIKTKAEYEIALQTIDSLMSASANTPEGDRLDTLVMLVEAYERTHCPIVLSDVRARNES